MAHFTVLALLSMALTVANISTEQLDSCVKNERNTFDFTKTYCDLKKEDVELLCPSDRIIVLKSLQLAVKNTSHCMKRVLDPDDKYCCDTQGTDIQYDGHCLQWYPEDIEHYKTFINNALRTCMNTSKCILSSHMFESLQRKIPDSHGKSNVYSSYFQISYQCIEEPESVKFCSSKSIQGKEIHLRGTSPHSIDSITNCTCIVTSHSDKNISVKAVDVRTTGKGLSFNTATLPESDLPLFGFREVFSQQEINISLMVNSENPGKDIKLWLQVSATDGLDLNVSCGGGGTAETKVLTTTPHVTFLTTTLYVTPQVSISFGNWPIVYLVTGPVITCAIVGCLLGAVYFYRYRRKRSHKHENSCPPSSHDYLQKNVSEEYDMPYATCRDQGREEEVCWSCSLSSHTLQRTSFKPYSRPHSRSTSMRSLRTRPPMAPPPPPQNFAAREFENNTQSYSKLSIPRGVSCDTLQLKTFTDEKDPVSSVGLSDLKVVEDVVDESRYESQSSFVQRCELESDHSSRSGQISVKGYDYVPSSPQRVSSVFGDDSSVNESFLGTGNTLSPQETNDVLGSPKEVNQSLLLDHKEDKITDFEIAVRPQITQM